MKWHNRKEKFFFVLLLGVMLGCTPPKEDTKEVVRIAVIDSGFKEEAAICSQAGWNYLEDSENTIDDVGHGTAVGELISKTAPEAVLIPLKVRGAEKMTTPEMVIAAINDAIDVFDCDIINISGGMQDTQELEAAINYAEEKGVLVVSAVGNQGNTYKSDKLYYPAGYETVIGVGTIEEDGQVAGYSQKNKSVFVVCKCGEKEGTSYSAALLTGLAANAMWNTPEEFRNWLCENARDCGEEGYDTEYGWGSIEVLSDEN